jgi:zinc transport system ATP-binding protein
MKQLIMECSNVSFAYNSTLVLDDVSLQLYRSTVTTVIGPNGGGKTTLGKILAGSIKPTSGLIKRAKGITVGYMPQKIHINHLMPITARQFLLLTLSKKINLKDFHKIVLQQKLEKLLDKQLYALSGGELQKILFTRLLVFNPDVMVLDEPTEGLDVVGQKEFYYNIEKLCAEQQKTILLISHDLYTVMSASNRVLCLDKVICCSGLPEAVSKNEHYEKMFHSKEQKEIFSYYQHSHEDKNV